MVRHTRVSNGTEQDAIKTSLLKNSQGISGHHRPLTQIALRPPVKLPRLQSKAAMQFSESCQGFDALRYDFWPNTITRYHSNLIVLHLASSLHATCAVFLSIQVRSHRCQALASATMCRSP